MTVRIGVGTTSDQSSDACRLVNLDLLIPLQRILVAPDLGDDGVTQAQSLVAMLLHIFDLVLSSFGDIDSPHCFKET